jgi:hypothetical protein
MPMNPVRLDLALIPPESCALEHAQVRTKRPIGSSRRPPSEPARRDYGTCLVHDGGG